MFPQNVSLGDILTGIGAIAAGIGVVYAAFQLRMSRKTAQGEFLFHLYDLMQKHNEVHLQLIEGKFDANLSEGDWMKVDRYMGLFEHIQILIDDGILNVEIVDRVFSHRVHAIVTNNAIVKRNLNDQKDRWKDFLKLHNSLLGKPAYLAVEASHRNGCAPPHSGSGLEWDMHRYPSSIVNRAI